METKLLELKNISKSFGPTKALSGVSFDLNRGEIHCLVGENGAGKSTLIKMLAGIHTPDAGEIYMNGSQVQIDSPNVSESLGISVVHQELMLCTDLTVAENIFLGTEAKKGAFLDKRTQIKRTKELLAEIDPGVDPNAVVNTLSNGKKQIVEIARAASHGKNVVVFDEPTSSLSREETDNLFRIVEGLRDKGIGIIYISHRLDEIFRLADKVTILRDGQTVGTLVGDEITEQTIVEKMVGRNIENYYTRNQKPTEEKLFEAEHVSGGVIRDASFYVKKGEILGFYGLIGAGRTELMRLIYGVDKIENGVLRMEGKEFVPKNTTDAKKHGVSYLPEDRKNEGLFLRESIGFNMSICTLDQIIKNFRVNKKREGELVSEYGTSMKLKMASVDQQVQSLSGGNQQKVLIGRELAVLKKMLILDEPTRGIDVGAKADIYRLLDDLTAEGFGIVLVSSELQEIVGMCDRVYVMRDFKISGCLNKEEINQVSIMNCAIGA